MSLASKPGKCVEWTPEKTKIKNGKCDMKLQANSNDQLKSFLLKKMY